MALTMIENKIKSIKLLYSHKKEYMMPKILGTFLKLDDEPSSNNNLVLVSGAT